MTDHRTETERETLSLMISASCLSICVCQPVFVTGALGFALARVWSVYPYFDSRHADCLPASASELHLSACSSRLRPNPASPRPATERHRWYMATSGAASELSFLSMMDGDFCRPVNTQSEPHCPDLRYSRTQVTQSEACHFNHSEHQLSASKIGVWMGQRVDVCVYVCEAVLLSHSVKQCCNHTAIGKCLHF